VVTDDGEKNEEMKPDLQNLTKFHKLGAQTGGMVWKNKPSNPAGIG
jgi:hypothetical protein